MSRPVGGGYQPVGVPVTAGGPTYEESDVTSQSKSGYWERLPSDISYNGYMLKWTPHKALVPPDSDLNLTPLYNVHTPSKWYEKWWVWALNYAHFFLFVLFYTSNAATNIALWTEYIRLNKQKRTFFEDLYIASLFAPFFGVICRLIARNYLKTILATAGQTVQFSESLILACASTNPYALFLLQRRRKIIFLMLFFDALEIIYSIWFLRVAADNKQVEDAKYALVVISFVIFVYDVTMLSIYRRFFDNIPYVLNPVWTLCDFTTRFHWEVENDLLKHMWLITHSFPKNGVRYDLHPYVVNAGLHYLEKREFARQERERVRQYAVGH